MQNFPIELKKIKHNSFVLLDCLAIELITEYNNQCVSFSSSDSKSSIICSTRLQILHGNTSLTIRRVYNQLLQQLLVCNAHFDYWSQSNCTHVIAFDWTKTKKQNKNGNTMPRAFSLNLRWTWLSTIGNDDVDPIETISIIL